MMSVNCRRVVLVALVVSGLSTNSLSGYIINVQSTPGQGCQILASPAEAGGTTDYTKSGVTGSVSFTAPETCGGRNFVKWTVVGDDEYYSRYLEYYIYKDLTFIAVYGEAQPSIELTLEETYSGTTPQNVFAPGEDVTVKLQAHNTGGSVDVAVTLNVFDSSFTYPSTDPSKIYDSHSEGEDQVSALDQDDTDNYSFTFTLPQDAPPGTYRVLGAIREQPWASVLDTTGPDIATEDWDEVAHLPAFQVNVFRVDDISIDIDPEDPEPIDSGSTVTGDGTITGVGDGVVEYRWIVRKPSGEFWPSELLSTSMTAGTAYVSSYNGFPTNDPGQHRVWIRKESPNGQDDTLSNWEYYTVVESSFPDLRPYQRSGWDNKLVIANEVGTTASADVIYSNENVYVDFACINSGDLDAGHFRYGLWVDGERKCYVDKASLAAGAHSFALDYDSGTLPPGWHTFTVKCDYDNEVDEGTDETNNEYSRDFYIAPAPPAPPPAGQWTVVTHGFLLPGATYVDQIAPDGILGAIADRIESLGPAGHVVTHSMSIDSSGFTLTPSTVDPSKHHVLLFDWTTTCGAFVSLLRDKDDQSTRDVLLDDGYAYSAGDALYALLCSHDIAQDVFCLIGYSRGAVVVSEATRRLILAGLDPQQVIFLDGEGGNLWIGYQDDRFDAWEPSGGRNVRYDNIYSNYNELKCNQPALGGHYRSRCWNYDLGDTYSHAGQAGLPCAPEVWRYLSDLMTCDGTRYTYPDQPQNSDTEVGLDPTLEEHYPKPLYHGDFEWNSPAGWIGHGGDGTGHVDCLGESSCHLELDWGDAERRHNWFWLDDTYTAFAFEYKVSNNDAVACDDYAVAEIACSDGESETWFVTDMCDETGWLYFADLTSNRIRGKLCRVSVRIEPGADDNIDSELHVDDVTFLKCTPPTTPTNVAANPQAVCSGESLMLTASVSGAEIDWYTGSCGGSFVDTGNSLSVSPDSNTTYYARSRDGATGCVSVGCDTIVVTVNPLPTTPANAAADPPEICEGASTILTASAGGAEIDWYTGSCGGSFVGTGNSISVSPRTTTTYYARSHNLSTGCDSETCDAVQATIVECDCVVDEDCDDGVDCTTDTCHPETNRCMFVVGAGFCAIDEVCYTDGVLNPDNECEKCDPTTYSQEWSPRAAGDPCGNSGIDYCDAQDTCDGNGACVDRYKDSGVICREASGTCDAPEYCTGTAPDCPPNVNQPDNTPCPDDYFCNGQETCQSGVCTDGTGPCGNDEVCYEAGDQCYSDCNHNDAPDETDIDTGVSLDCNSNAIPDECEDLLPGDFDFDGKVTEQDVEALVDCQTDPCPDPPCMYPLYEDVCCAIGDFESDGDVDLQDYAALQAQAGCQSNADCDDQIRCTDDVCLNGQCTHSPNDSHCPDDGEFCNGIESCDALLDCVSTGSPCTDPEFPICLEDIDACGVCQTTADCADSNLCTQDLCINGMCENPPVECTEYQTCDPATGGCTPDCNENGVPDYYDIAEGTSQDTNSNGIPDECQGEGDPDLLLYYPFDGDSQDASGNENNGSDSNVSYVSGRWGSAASFNGTDSVIDLAAPFQPIGNDYSVSVWIKTAGSSAYILNTTGPIEDPPGYHNAYILGVNSPHLKVYHGDLGVLNASGVLDNTWHHVVSTWDSSTFTLAVYTDGELNTSITYTSESYYTSADETRIGTDMNGAYAYSGLLDELRIYRRLLDADEISRLANPDCNNNGILDEVDIENGTSLDCNTNGIPDECDIAGGASVDADGNGIPDECQGEVYPDLLVYYPFDGDSHDASGNENNGSASNVSYVEGRLGYAASFNGTNSVIDLAAPFQPIGNDYSVSVWIKTAGSSAYILNTTGPIEDPPGYHNAYILGVNSPDLKVYHGDLGVLNASGVLDNTWHHVVSTWDSSTFTLSIYTDGELNASITYTSESSYTSADETRIGTDKNGAYTYTGLLDELRIYGRLLSAQEISQLGNP